MKKHLLLMLSPCLLLLSCNINEMTARAQWLTGYQQWLHLKRDVKHVLHWRLLNK